MVRRTAWWLGGAVIVLVVVAAWLGLGGQQQRGPGSTLTIGLEIEPDRLSPLVAKNPKTFIILMQIFEGLLTLDEKGQIKPGIAESWSTADGGKTWLFKIRGNASFHDSEIFGAARTRPITVDDTVWSFNKICAPGTYASFVLADVIVGCADHNSGKAPSVAGVSAKDASTLQITLVKPELFFPFRLTTGCSKHSARNASCSSLTRARTDRGIPSALNSAAIQPMPTPSSKRSPVSSWTVAIAFAVGSIGRYGRISAPVPNLIFDVKPPSQASVVSGSV